MSRDAVATLLRLQIGDRIPSPYETPEKLLSECIRELDERLKSLEERFDFFHGEDED